MKLIYQAFFVIVKPQSERRGLWYFSPLVEFDYGQKEETL
jgi:hypothetical protein